MTSIKVNFKEYPYEIIVGDNIIKKYLGSYLHKLDIGSDAYVVTNAFIKNKYGKILFETLKQSGFHVNFKLIPDTEKSKSIETAFSLLKDLAVFDKKKRVFIIAFGGGVIGDISGFIASIYKRGIPYIQIPTTLLSQVDSSIGGKTAVDLPQGKNLVGAFYQPKLVFSDISFLKTLNQKQLSSGLSEIIKYGIIKSPQLFNYLEKRHNDIFTLKNKSLEFIVNHCSNIKAKIIQDDEREKKGIRTILNFGHTIGHAIEAAGNYKSYTHGEAIALGMLTASDISRKLKLISPKTYYRIRDLIKLLKLPVKIKKLFLNDIIKIHYSDKKFIGSKNKFVLIKGIGKAIIKENIPLEIIKEAIRLRF